MLQSSGRATVVGQYASTGAGGSIKRAALPGGLAFQYPYTGVVFDGTNELVLEAKGVEPDVRVPVTLESEAARIAGEDPVLAAGLDTLKQLAAAALCCDHAGAADRSERRLHHRQPGRMEPEQRRLSQPDGRRIHHLRRHHAAAG